MYVRFWLVFHLFGCAALMCPNLPFVYVHGFFAYSSFVWLFSPGVSKSAFLLVYIKFLQMFRLFRCAALVCPKLAPKFRPKISWEIQASNSGLLGLYVGSMWTLRGRRAHAFELLDENWVRVLAPYELRNRSLIIIIIRFTHWVLQL